MRKLGEIIQEFRGHPLKYWLGWNPSCSYELNGQRIIKRVGDSVSALVSVTGIVSWKARGRGPIAIRLPEETVIVFDRSGKLRSILERVVGDKQDRSDDI
jgi:hypothetical protein